MWDLSSSNLPWYFAKEPSCLNLLNSSTMSTTVGLPNLLQICSSNTAQSIWFLFCDCHPWNYWFGCLPGTRRQARPFGRQVPHITGSICCIAATKSRGQLPQKLECPLSGYCNPRPSLQGWEHGLSSQLPNSGVGNNPLYSKELSWAGSKGEGGGCANGGWFKLSERTVSPTYSEVAGYSQQV